MSTGVRPARSRAGARRRGRAAAAVLTVLLAAVVLAGLSVLGSVLSARWEPALLPAAEGYADIPAAPPAQAPSELPVRREDVRIALSDTTLAGTVIAPQRPGRYPGVVVVHGAGTGERSGYLDQAERIAHSGVVTLVYDKRRVGYSIRHRDYSQLADDALAGIGLLRRRADVEPSRVGLWGVSEGGWVVPIAAARSSDVAFAVLVSAPTVSPLRQVVWSLEASLRRLDAPDGAREVGAKALGLGRLDYLRHDPLPALRGLHQPVLAVYGTADRAVPPAQSARTLSRELAAAGNSSYTIRFFADADHGLRVGGQFAPGYVDTVSGWVRGLPASATPAGPVQVAGAVPAQRYAAGEIPSPPWYASGAAFAVAFALAAAGFLAGPVAARATRRRTGGAERASLAWRGVRRRLRVLTLSALALAVLLNVIIGVLMVFAFTDVGSGPIVRVGWLALRSLATLTVVLGAVAVTTAVLAGRRGWRSAGAQRVALLGVGAGSLIVLTIAAYWGLFAPRW